jgi:1-acyl-sn-glycerol-3-phosphate acyltransferase
MNRQPYCTPPKWWAPQLTPWCVRISRRYRWWQLRSRQRIERVEVEQGHHLKDALGAKQGVLITPNHSTHYDSAALYIAADQLDVPLYFMTAWQVFAMSSRFEVLAMQRLGCFSIDRESTDRQAFKQAVEVLQTQPYPLVIFPEGDIYHTNDSITPFREGAAAIALSAAKRAERKVVIVPTAIKFFYIDDPTEELLATMTKLEERVLLRPAPHRPLIERIYRLAEGIVALKELDFFTTTRSGGVKERAASLIDAILTQMELRHALPSRGSVPERAKAIRQALIKKIEDDGTAQANGALLQLQQEVEDVFFVMQLYSYPGDYLHAESSIERIAETVDKFEEDILGLDLPTVRGRRRVVVRFGHPLEATAGDGKKVSSAEMTTLLHGKVQELIHGINADHGSRTNAAALPG